MNDWTEKCDGPGKSACRRSAALCAIVAALALGSACIAVQVGRRQAAQLQRRVASADAAWNASARQVQEVLALRRSQPTITQHAEQAEILLEKIPRSTVLAEVTNALPAGCWLANFRLDSADADGDALRVQLAGVAPGDAETGQYVARLRQSKLLHNVKLTASQAAQEQGRRLRKFRIELSVGDAPHPAAPAQGPTLTASIGH